MARHLVGSREAGDGLIRVLLVGERHERAPCHTTLASAPPPPRVRYSSRCGAVPRRAHIQGSHIVVSINSGLESNKEENERAPCHTTLASAPQPTHVRCSSRVAGLFSNCAPSVNYQKRCARVPYTGDATNAHPATPPTHAPTHRRASHILPLLPFYSRA